MGPGAQDETTVAIAAFDEVLIAHLQIDLGMAERATAAVAGDAAIVHFDYLGGIDGHFASSLGSGADYNRPNLWSNCQALARLPIWLF
jgi:hypothetical protein